MKKLFLGLVIAITYTGIGQGEILTLIDELGQETSLEVASKDQFSDVLDVIKGHFHAEGAEDLPSCTEVNSLQLNLSFLDGNVMVRAKKKPWRNYKAGYSKADKEDIKFIVNTLARESLINIGSSSSSLNKAGDRINHLHPFNFLLCIFTDEELKCGAHAIRDRTGLVSDRFFSGITSTLQEEHQQNNLSQHIGDFAKKLNLDVNVIQPVLNGCHWRAFVELLIDTIPRKNDPSRYNM